MCVCVFFLNNLFHSSPSLSTSPTIVISNMRLLINIYIPLWNHSDDKCKKKTQNNTNIFINIHKLTVFQFFIKTFLILQYILHNLCFSWSMLVGSWTWRWPSPAKPGWNLPVLSSNLDSTMKNLRYEHTPTVRIHVLLIRHLWIFFLCVS